MKKAVSLIAIIAVLAVLVFAGVKFYMHQKSSQYAKTAVPYVKMVIPEISKWDPAIVRKYMPAEALAGTSQEKMDKILAYLSKLGGLKTMQEPVFSGEDNTVMYSGKPHTMLTYKVNVEYDKGAAVFTIGLLHLGNNFQVHNFNINSKALLQ